MAVAMCTCAQACACTAKNRCLDPHYFTNACMAVAMSTCAQACVCTAKNHRLVLEHSQMRAWLSQCVIAQACACIAYCHRLEHQHLTFSKMYLRKYLLGAPYHCLGCLQPCGCPEAAGKCLQPYVKSLRVRL